MTDLILNPGAHLGLAAGHPWIMAKDVARTHGRAAPGSTVDVRDHDGNFLARAAISPSSKIRARVWHRDPDVSVDHAWFKARIAAAQARRLTAYTGALPGAYRLVNAEGDGLPGVTIDRYGDVLVAQLTACGADKWRDAIVQAAVAATGCAHVFERSDASVREQEGLERTSGCLAGDPTIGTREAPLEVFEGAARFLVDVQTGHKTGFYLDQAQNRQLAARLAPGKAVLNCFSYTGGFGLAAAAAGASRVVNIDSSAPALALGEQAAAGQGYAAALEWLRSDVKKALASLAEQGTQRFDLVIMDPPKLAPTQSSKRKAMKLYEDLNARAMGLLNPGGSLLSFSCSGAVSLGDFRQMLAGAAARSGRQMAALQVLGSGPDHPGHPTLSGSGYLKGLWLQAID